MTAARIGVATLTAVVWVAAAALLWQTQVPDDLDVVSDTAPFAALGEERAERHDSVLRLLAIGSLAAQLGALLLYARRAPRVRGRALVRAAQLGALAAVVLLVAVLPFAAATLWWQRRYGIAQLGYARWGFDLLGPLAVRAGLLAVAAVLFVWLSARFGRRWWLAAAVPVALLGVGVIVAQPLVSPRLEPVPRPAVVEQVRRIAAEEGLPRPEVELRRTTNRTRQLNAEAIGIGPTTRVILWGTTLHIPSNVRGVLVAHELGHVARRHVWKGLVWFVLFAVPGLALLGRLAPLDSPEGVPRAVLVAFVLLLLATPAINGVSRHYEREADWVALETTRDPAAARRLMVLFAQRGVRDPSPPRVWTLLFGTHPTLADRVGLADAWARSAGRESRAGS